jgi:Plant transposon protein
MDDDSDDDSIGVIARPTNILQCITKDGSINLMKYLLYRRHKRRQKQKNEEVKRNDDNLIDDAYELFMQEAEENGDKYFRTQHKQTRSVFRKNINRRRNADGSIDIITAKQSSWYITYVENPEQHCNKFINKFRRRFRCHYDCYLILLDLIKNDTVFSRWRSTFDAVGRECSPIELLLLGTLRYLGRGWCFDDLEEATSISEETHRVFFHIFIQWGKTSLYNMYVKVPRTVNDISKHTSEMEQAGLHGCIGSVDATHVGMLRCPYARWNQHKGPKLSMPCRSYNIVVNHRRQIISSTQGHPSRWNDKTITLHDEFIQLISTKRLLNDNIFYLLKNVNGTIIRTKCKSCWLLCDNGYPFWPCLIPPLKDPIRYPEFRFSEWIESMRKDVECTFGIMKGRFRVLKTGIRIHGVEVTDSIWLTCCALHNLFLEHDGLDTEWENGTSIWTGSLGDHDEADVNNYAPPHLLRENNNPAQFDLSGMGPGNDGLWENDEFNEYNNNIDLEESNINDYEHVNDTDNDSNDNEFETDNSDVDDIDVNDIEYENNNNNNSIMSYANDIGSDDDDVVDATNNVEINNNDTVQDAIDLNDIAYEDFRQLLIEHYDVLYQQRKLIWPSRLGKVTMRYNTTIA